MGRDQPFAGSRVTSFYRRLNQILDRARFDRYVERFCRRYYAPTLGRPALAPGVYFRCFLVGYFEGIDSERGVAYRVSDSLSLREFLGLSLGTHQAVFCWVLKQLAREGLLSGWNVGVDATTLEADAALKSTMRRDNGASHEEYVAQLMENEGVEEPSPAQRQRWDGRRKKSPSSRKWVNPHDPPARITKLKDGRTQLAYQAEQAAEADAVGPVKAVSEVGVERVVADKGYHSKQVFGELAEVGVRTLMAEPERKRQRWAGQRRRRRQCLPTVGD